MVGRVTPQKITSLSSCEVFVFGCNREGKHRSGAALFAREHFGAKWGVSSGPTGKCYAIPTRHLTLNEIKPYVDEFITYAKAHPTTRFLVTKIGCGGAGYTDKEMAPLFKETRCLPNVCLPIDWFLILDSDELLDAYFLNVIPKKQKVNIPKALTEKDLMRLCEEYKYIIGSRIIDTPKPEIRIRYVIDRNRFGYASFGDFFFWDSGDLYVWTRNKEFAEDHNQDVVEGFFGDECYGRGYCHRVIFAGVDTGLKDINGESIFTGDVLHIKGDFFEETYALGTLGENMDGREAYYAFALDNHCIVPEMCRSMRREGTVFFQLDWCDDPMKSSDFCQRFQPIYGDTVSREDREVMARYTPNFDKEVWKYIANDKLGIEFNWRK